MTEVQKELLIAKMLDAPASLSDEELDAIVHDEELREIHEISSAVCGACAQQPEIDMTEEWVRFRRRMRSRKSRWHWIMRVAAVFVGVVFVSGIVVRMVDGLFVPDNSTAMVEKADTTMSERILSPDAVPLVSHVPVEKADTVAASPKMVRVSKPLQRETDVTGEKEADTAREIDVDEYLRIQQARIDNDLALQNAAIYEDEYHTMIQMLDMICPDEYEIHYPVRKVIMQ